MQESTTGNERNPSTSSTSSSSPVDALEILGKFFTHVIPPNVVRFSAAREQFIADHDELLERYGEEVYTVAVNNLIGSAYFDPRNAAHLERECQRVQAQAPSTPDALEEAGGDVMPWDS